MKFQWKNSLRTATIYLIVVIITLGGHTYYQAYKTQEYVDEFKALKGQSVIGEISDTYKSTIEHYSNYKLNKEAKHKIIRKLNKLSEELRKIDLQINSRDVYHQIDFSFIYHDIKLVNITLSDTTKDDIVPVIVLHAMEGLGEIKKEITYIEYR
ncbi:hypothetical protein GCM10011571_11480 [Marinithermofilum abyssi]|uniref:Uncharacterized protein n=1 Tax=Marinithermofilum abyssi TaxID=1571185 RepID=A0A8J2VHZ1_9BACL|nr:hypothetical protein [Marinithermofilum abyssi]GGE11787.1 hypothetical protein GCM10011571_11480 [Marinithermofilum abyssi]